ncbi:MAG: hypothetical protein F7C35_02575 [Desulfurococcales archaeon]|nr:hypothetical protein [Desulfurococcales archaeon]
MGKAKTSILVDQQLWQRFKREVGKRFKGRRPSVPPVSSVVEDLVRGWLEGLHRVKVPLYEVAYILSLEPKTLLLYARVNPDLAFKVFQARPQAFLRLIATDFTPRSLEEAENQYYVVGDDKVNLILYDDWDKEWYDSGDFKYFISRNRGTPYFNDYSLEVLLGEGYPEIVAAHYLGLSEICVFQGVTFSLHDPEGWRRLLGILEELVASVVRPARTYLKDKECDAYTLTREIMGKDEGSWNAVRFLRLVSTWIPSNLPRQAPVI